MWAASNYCQIDFCNMLPYAGSSWTHPGLSASDIRLTDIQIAAVCPTGSQQRPDPMQAAEEELGSVSSWSITHVELLVWSLPEFGYYGELRELFKTLIDHLKDWITTKLKINYAFYIFVVLTLFITNICFIISWTKTTFKNGRGPCEKVSERNRIEKLKQIISHDKVGNTHASRTNFAGDITFYRGSGLNQNLLGGNGIGHWWISWLLTAPQSVQGRPGSPVQSSTCPQGQSPGDGGQAAHFPEPIGGEEPQMCGMQSVLLANEPSRCTAVQMRPS